MISWKEQKEQAMRALGGAAIAFGVFDGVHKGHQYLINQTKAFARQQGVPCVVLTFEIDPDELFSPQHLKKIVSNERRIALLEELGVDDVVVLPFDRSFSALSPCEFIAAFLEKNPPFSLHVGFDLRFGSHATGTVDTLQQWAQGNEVRIVSYDLCAMQLETISSTNIRAHLAACEIQRANELLGRPYSMEGVVQEGRQQGRDFGFRTANLHIDPLLYSLGEGVYGAYAITEEGTRYKAAVSVGGAPTFGEGASANLEVHLLDFDEDIYGQMLRIEFVAFLRPMIVFETLDELIETVMGNIAWCRDNL